MCKYCNKKENLDSDLCKIYIKDNILCIDYDAYSTDSSFNEKIEINYCPICGKHLIIKNDNE